MVKKSFPVPLEFRVAREIRYIRYIYIRICLQVVPKCFNLVLRHLMNHISDDYSNDYRLLFLFFNSDKSSLLKKSKPVAAGR